MISIRFLTFLVGVTLLSCNKDEPIVLYKEEGIQPVVEFDIKGKGDCTTPVVVVILENKSTGVDSYAWDFGDGTTSVETNPSKVYNRSGKYTITLTAYYQGRFKQIEKEVWISRNSDGNGPSLHLTYELDSLNPFLLRFEITTDGIPTLDFGDGTALVRDTKIGSHRYAGPGRYYLWVNSQNIYGSSCATGLVDVKVM